MVTKKIAQITSPDGTTTTEEQVVPSEEFVAPPVQSVGGEDMTTLSSNSAAAKDKSNKESSNSNSSNKKKYIIIGGTAGVLLLGLIIGLAVGFSGNDSFTYRSRDNSVASPVASVSIEVTEVVLRAVDLGALRLPPGGDEAARL